MWHAYHYLNMHKTCNAAHIIIEMDTSDPIEILGTWSDAAKQARSNTAERSSAVIDQGGASVVINKEEQDAYARDISDRLTRRLVVLLHTPHLLNGKPDYKRVYAPYAFAPDRYVLCNYKGTLTEAGSSNVSFGSAASLVSSARAAAALVAHKSAGGKSPRAPYMTLDEYMAWRIEANARVYPNIDREKTLLNMQLATDMIMEPRMASGELPNCTANDPLMIPPDGSSQMLLFRDHVCRMRTRVEGARQENLMSVYPTNWESYSSHLPERIWGSSARLATRDDRLQQRPFVGVFPLWAVNRHDTVDPDTDDVFAPVTGTVGSRDYAPQLTGNTMPLGILMFEWKYSRADRDEAARLELPRNLAEIFAELSYTIYEMPHVMGRQINATATSPRPSKHDCVVAYYLIDCGLDARHHRSLVPICVKILPGGVGAQPPTTYGKSSSAHGVGAQLPAAAGK